MLFLYIVFYLIVSEQSMVGGKKHDLRGSEVSTEAEAELSNDSKAIIASIRNEFNMLRSEFVVLKTVLENKNTEITAIKAKVSVLEDEIVYLKDNLDSADAYERRDAIIISGNDIPVVTNGEISSNIVCDLVKSKLHVNMLPTDISTSHRLGKKPNSQAPDRRRIIVKLCRRDIKHQILYACREHKPKDLYINESLTPLRSKIMFALRKMKREPNSRIATAGSNDGKVYVWVKHQHGSPEGSRDVKIMVNTHSKLEEISMNIMGKPLTEYVENWSQ